MKPCVFLDENITKSFEAKLRNAGFNTYRPRKGATDKEVFQGCLAKGCILITKDKDFLRVDYLKLKGFVLIEGKDKHIERCFDSIVKHIKVGVKVEIKVNSNCKVSWKPI